eukprot:gene17391-biopygen17329
MPRRHHHPLPPPQLPNGPRGRSRQVRDYSVCRTSRRTQLSVLATIYSNITHPPAHHLDHPGALTPPAVGTSRRPLSLARPRPRPGRNGSGRGPDADWKRGVRQNSKKLTAGRGPDAGSVVSPWSLSRERRGEGSPPRASKSRSRSLFGEGGTFVDKYIVAGRAPRKQGRSTRCPQ